mgnify:FL=1
MTPGWPKANGERIKMTMRIVKMRLVRELPGKFLGVRAKVPVDQHDSNEVGKQKWEQKEKIKVYPDQ